MVFPSTKTIKYIAFKYNLIDWIILNPNLKSRLLKEKIPFLITQLVKFVGFTRPWPLKRIPKLLTHKNLNLVKLLLPIKCFGVNKLSSKKKQGFILLTLCPTR